ncbi:Bifunctional epoxide hydrolase 2 [Pseudocercospora fuligena]|uniref:Bifunctional epoxide hydrolase 2 n=1 Tax=Pseudocercospora fuligena TaxID=685502 RepID=A0A8H6VHT5_9PEZI|nr:Bifunctional epoxide hydrolase 2 [Pseudocercospora fuligena]
MDKLDEKSFKAASGVNYVYWTAKANGDKQTILLLHGCPDSASLWSDLISSHLLPNGYGIIAPDLIGYGSSDKPEDVSFYSMNSICKDMMSLLEHEHTPKVIVLGHDFGVFLASKMYSFHPDAVIGLITLGSAYVPPSPVPFDFEQIKAMMEQYQGYCSIWYFELFTRDKGYQVIDANLESFFTALHGGGERMKEVCCNQGAFEAWLKDEGNILKSVLPYADRDGFREEWVERLRRDGLRGPMNWYKAIAKGLITEADKEALKNGTHVVARPYLTVLALQDPLAPAVAVHGLATQGLLPEVSIKEVDAGHWSMYEKPKEVGDAVVSWLQEKHKGLIQL